MESVALSLVVATVERTEELRRLFFSFAGQPFREFEVILVDQNDDDRLTPMVAEFASQFPIRHLRSERRNCSNARNLGLAEASGPIVGFPDDDCEYKPDTMLRVTEHFARDPELVLLGGPCVSPTGMPINGRWSEQSCAIDEKTVWTTIAGFTMWMRTAAARDVGGFDPLIGPGTPWGSSEEPDLGIRLLRRGNKGFYDRDLGILHPNKALTAHATARAFLYGAGMGRVMRKHAIPLRIVLPYFVRPLGGICVSLFRLKRIHVRYYRETLRGRLFGYRSEFRS